MKAAEFLGLILELQRSRPILNGPADITIEELNKWGRAISFEAGYSEALKDIRKALKNLGE